MYEKSAKVEGAKAAVLLIAYAGAFIIDAVAIIVTFGKYKTGLCKRLNKHIKINKRAR